MHIAYPILLGFSTLFLAATSLAQTVEPKDPPLVQTIALTNESGSDAWGGVADSQGRLWTALYPTRHRLILKDPQNQEIPLVATQYSAPSGLALAPGDAGRVWIAYRNKAPERGIFVVRSDAPGLAYKVSGDSLPLARVRLAADGQGGVYVLWYDESPLATQSQQIYWLWFNHLDRNGQIGVPKRVLPGIYPTWLANVAGQIAVFSWYGDSQGARIGMRQRNLTGDFDPAIEIAKVRYFSPPFGAFNAGNRWFVYWIAQYGELRDEFLIEGASSDDQGHNWRPFSLETLRKLDVRNLETAADGQGHIALVITGRYRHPQPEQTDKLTAYLVTSNDNGNTWNTPQHLQPDGVTYSQAPNAKVAFIGVGTNQQLLISVEDWSTIRASIRYWLSADNGNTWLLKDQPLLLDPAFNYQLSYADPTFYLQPNKVTLLVERLGDGSAQRTILAYTQSLHSLANPEPIAKRQPDLNQLKIRVNAYGQALVKRNYQFAYDCFDPFYRAKIDFLGHMQGQGRIVYTTAEFAGAQIHGQLATVQLHIVASVPPFKGANGETIQAPLRDVVFPIHWLWIDGNWYMEYYSEARELRYTRY